MDEKKKTEMASWKRYALGVAVSTGVGTGTTMYNKFLDKQVPGPDPVDAALLDTLKGSDIPPPMPDNDAIKFFHDKVGDEQKKYDEKRGNVPITDKAQDALVGIGVGALAGGATGGAVLGAGWAITTASGAWKRRKKQKDGAAVENDSPTTTKSR